MTDKQTNIVTGVLALFVPFVYFVGVMSWQNTQLSDQHEVVAKGKHIYFVCYSSALYGAATIGVLLTKYRPVWLKILCTVTHSVCAVILYEEIRYGDRQWTVWSWGLMPVVFINYVFFYILLERFKKSINYGR